MNRIQSLLAFAALSFCGCSDPFTGPRSYSTSVPARAPVTLRFSVDSALLIPGDDQAMSLTWVGDVGALRSVRWQSENESVASISPTGIITAHSPGRTRISAVAVFPEGFGQGSIPVIVRDDGLAGVVFLNDARGWIPSMLRVSVGTRVTWRSGPTGWMNQWQTALWGDFGGEADSLDLRSGRASFVFTKPGTYVVCSASCWDREDTTTIEVR